MSARLALYGLLWRAALAQTHPYAHRVVIWLTPVLSLAAAVLAWKVYGLATAASWGVNALCSMVLLTWTWGFLPGAFKLNSPANAQLTPVMRGRLLELAMAVWLPCIAGLALANAGSASDVVLRVVWWMVASLGLALAATGNGAGSVLFIAIWPLMGLPSFIPDRVHAMMAHPAFLPLLALLLVAPGLATIRTIFPRAGDRHWRQLEKRNIWRDKDALRNREDGRFMRWWHARSLRRASDRRDLGAMLLHGSGPGLQAGGIVLGIAGVGLLGLVLVGLMHLGGYRHAAELALKMGWMWSLMPLVLFQMHALLLASLAEAPAGQSLLRLAPAMPATAPRFNRLLASKVLRSSMVAWAMAAATALACSALTGAGVDELLMVACLSGLALPTLIMPLRDHARRSRWNSVLQWLLVLVIAGACLLVGVFGRAILGLPVFSTAAVFAVLLTVVLAARRYRAMLRSPFALPAGRLD
ncbi:hypothetical protein [Massilia sp. CFBP9026]|uniref:hypothetical protein n=1 Tax=Massilia sp. CFBP9026 TaxID=3096536 RepID=UPI002A6B2EE0|nr:hypothetical protein [Massilia sp. CFBP9026]MDY0962934.1 hypothetical protein [Massilia sp. CFBP9026]